MSGGHLHLILNHIPVIGIYFALLILIVGFIKKNVTLKYMALWLLLVLAIIALPTYFTGESAEEVVERMPYTSEEMIHQHEWAAELSFIAFIITGILVILVFLTRIFRGRLSQPFLILVLLMTIITAGLTAWTANLGGKIRRPELRGEEVKSAIERYLEWEESQEDSLQSPVSDSL